MPLTLSRYDFGPELLDHPDITTFYCGDEVWERAIADWIKDPEGALRESRNRKRPCRIWVYANDTDEIVGYGSLGKAKARWHDGNREERIETPIIPMLGIQRRFQGLPKEPRDARPSYQILDDLIAEARRMPDVAPLLRLFVHPDNRRAIEFYRRFGFAFHAPNYREGDIEYQGMVLNL